MDLTDGEVAAGACRWLPGPLVGGGVLEVERRVLDPAAVQGKFLGLSIYRTNSILKQASGISFHQAYTGNTHSSARSAPEVVAGAGVVVVCVSTGGDSAVPGRVCAQQVLEAPRGLQRHAEASIGAVCSHRLCV